MTAEIIVLNRGAVAIAADSAVTVSGTDQRNKVFNSANKLMMLSEHAPVAVMIYDNAELLGFPWETLVKTFRNQLGKTTHSTLRDYANELIAWLSDEIVARIPQDSHETFEESAIRSAMSEARDRGLAQIERTLRERTGVTHLAVQRTLATEIKKFWQAIRELPYYDGWDEMAERKLARVWSSRIDELRPSVFEHLPLSDASIATLRRIGVAGLTRVGGPAPTTGLVVTGFGDNQVFPAVMSYRISGVLDESIRCFTDPNTTIVSGADTGGIIIPFAQRDMVATFIEGIDPELSEYTHTLIRQTLAGVPSAFVPGLDGLNRQDARKLEESLHATLSRVYTEVADGLSEYRKRHHVDPVLELVNHMPKEDLATLAEALVSLTSLKRKVTMVPETVGGPIDVAVISKGDGFVWIRRKHYFDQSLNPRFIARYYQDRQGDISSG